MRTAQHATGPALQHDQRAAAGDRAELVDEVSRAPIPALEATAAFGRAYGQDDAGAGQILAHMTAADLRYLARVAYRLGVRAEALAALRDRGGR